MNSRSSARTGSSEHLREWSRQRFAWRSTWLSGSTVGRGTTRTNSLLVWELHEAGADELFRGALEVLSDAERFNVPVLLVAPPSVLERVPEVFHQVLELAVDDQGRQEFRRSECRRPGVRLLARDS